MPNDNTVGGQPWTNYLKSINELESITGYNYLSNISTEIQEEIENNTTRFNPLSSSLLADEGLTTHSFSRLLRINFNTPVRHSSVPEEGIIRANESPVSRSTEQVSAGQVSMTQVGMAQVGSP